MSSTYLAVAHSTSRGYETMGYPIVRVTDQNTGQSFRTMGGGYDMLGTVFADWLQATFQDRLMSELGAMTREELSRQHYGARHIFLADGSELITLDGACGQNSIERIARAIGLQVRHTWNRRGHTTGFMVTDTRD